MITDKRVLKDFVDHYMSTNTQDTLRHKFSNTNVGEILFKTYSSYTIIIEVIEALLEMTEIEYKEKYVDNIIFFERIS